MLDTVKQGRYELTRLYVEAYCSVFLNFHRVASWCIPRQSGTLLSTDKSLDAAAEAGAADAADVELSMLNENASGDCAELTPAISLVDETEKAEKPETPISAENEAAPATPAEQDASDAVDATPAADEQPVCATNSSSDEEVVSSSSHHVLNMYR